MPKVPFHYVDLRAFSYATEDVKRVEQALYTLLPEDVELERAETADEMRHVLDRLSGLEDLDRVLDELDERVDDNCALFLRLDKQAAFRGDVRLGPGLTVRTKVEAYPAKKEKAVANARETLSRLADGDDD
jgi:RNA binding exosome subunit